MHRMDSPVRSNFEPLPLWRDTELLSNRSQREASSSCQKKSDTRRHCRPTVIPAKAGIQEDTARLHSATLDSRLRGNDGERLAVNGYTLDSGSPCC